jgi:hypothetical protein
VAGIKEEVWIMREDLRTFMQQEGPPKNCIHGVPEDRDCPDCIRDRWEVEYRLLENDLADEKNHSEFLERLLEALYGPGWRKLTIVDARKFYSRNHS